MGYTTDFYGEFMLDKPLTPAHKAYLCAFNEKRHMARKVAQAKKMPDPIRAAVGLPLGRECEFFVGGLGFAGQDKDASIIDFNRNPSTQPGLWCQWVPNEDGTAIVWDGGEKFYYYVEWIEYIIENFLKPWGYSISGEVEWQGEEREDIGKIQISNNSVNVLHGSIIFN